MSVQRVSHGEQMPSRTEAGMRVGLVGVGRIGVLHAETLADNPQVSQLRIADADPARAREVAGKVGATVTGLRELFSGAVDALVVAAATGAHAELVQRGAEAGLPVFCEKPLAADVAGTRRVLARVAAAGTSLQVGFQRRFDHGYRAGDVDTSAVLLTLDDGTLGVVSGGRYNGGGYDARLEVAGSEGTVVAGLDERAPLRSAEQGVSWPPGQPYASFYERFRRAYVAELGEFLDHVLGRIPTPARRRRRWRLSTSPRRPSARAPRTGPSTSARCADAPGPAPRRRRADLVGRLRG